ncbi:MAG TPA: DNA-processing protein DprA [Alphaproteobacteria bacterium]|nr:DNA-processing protein DprA [Alphaproteobacteria bacterium]
MKVDDPVRLRHFRAMPGSTPFSPNERLDWLRLIRTENVGPVTFYQLLAHYGSARSALEFLPELAHRGGRRQSLRIPSRADGERELAAIEGLGGRIICRDEPGYPAPMRAVEDAPPVLILRGTLDPAGKRTIGIVGARNASASGRRFARQLAHEIGAAGIFVISGLARGIDTSAHEGSLETGTIAVMAGGVDIVYPEENRALYGEIVRRGIVVSEMPPGTVPQGRHFPRRNRIVSGFSLGVVVVEAAERSGSLITARFAAEQGREVFAVPGSPLDPRCKGTNALIRDGAYLTESASDVIAVLDAMGRRALTEPGDPPKFTAPQAAGPETELSMARRRVLEALGPTPVAVDEILRQTQLTSATLSMVLLELELAGRLERHPGNRVSICA